MAAAPPQNICEPINEDLDFKNEFENYLFSPQYDPAILSEQFDAVGRYNITFSLNDAVGPLTQQRISNDFFLLTFHVERTIANGANGTVYKLRSDCPRLNLAIKFTRNLDDDQISRDLEAYPLPAGRRGCDLLKVKPTGRLLNLPGPRPPAQIHSFFMQCANGTLGRFWERFFNRYQVRGHNYIREHILVFCEHIRTQMLCLLDMPGNNYVYADLKLDNILYLCNDPANLNRGVLMIGDLGGAVGDAFGNYVATYPPAEYVLDLNGNSNGAAGNLNLPTLADKEQTLAWLMGILLLSFIPGNPQLIYYWETLNLYGLTHVNYNNALQSLQHFYNNPNITNFLFCVPGNPVASRAGRTSIRVPLTNYI